jgi:hypothetical protein
MVKIQSTYGLHMGIDHVYVNCGVLNFGFQNWRPSFDQQHNLFFFDTKWVEFLFETYCILNHIQMSN